MIPAFALAIGFSTLAECHAYAELKQLPPDKCVEVPRYAPAKSLRPKARKEKVND